METRLATNSARASQALPDDPLRAEVATLFSAFARLFGHKWERTFADDKARAVWLATMRHARIDAAKVRIGLAAASQLAWPPSAGEFAGMCTPPATSDREAFREAMARARGVELAWSHPAIGAAYLDVGSWHLRTATERDGFSAFAASYRQMRERYGRGEDLSPPTVRAIPADVRGPPASATTASAAIAACKAALGITSALG